MLGVAAERRLREVRIARQEAVRRRVEIGEIAPAAARNQDLRPHPVGMVEQKDIPATLAGGQRAHQPGGQRSEEHTSELQSLMRISYAVFCLKKKKKSHY